MTYIYTFSDSTGHTRTEVETVAPKTDAIDLAVKRYDEERLMSGIPSAEVM